MTDILVLLDHPTTRWALILARRWCKDRRIGSEDALSHALAVVDELQQHIHDVAPDVVAAALLHDSPDLAPPTVDLDASLAALSPEVARLVRALQDEHDQLAAGTLLMPPTGDLGLMQLSAADKIVSIQGVLHRAGLAADRSAYWTERREFVATLGYLRDFHHAAAQVLPPRMAGDLGHLIGVAHERATRHGRR